MLYTRFFFFCLKNYFLEITLRILGAFTAVQRQSLPLAVLLLTAVSCVVCLLPLVCSGFSLLETSPGTLLTSFSSVISLTLLTCEDFLLPSQLQMWPCSKGVVVTESCGEVVGGRGAQRVNPDAQRRLHRQAVVTSTGNSHWDSNYRKSPAESHNLLNSGTRLGGGGETNGQQ